MKIELTEKETKEIIKKSVISELESRVTDELYDVMNSDELHTVIIEVLIEYIKSNEGRELLIQSFNEHYIAEGDWMDMDNILESANDEVENLIKNLFKGAKIKLCED